MKLNLTFVPVDGTDTEFKVVCFGERDSLLEVARLIQIDNFCTNVFFTDDKKES